MNRLSRATVALSALAALGTIAFVAYGHGLLFRFALTAWLLLFLLSGRFTSVALGIVLLCVYLTPAMSMIAIGRNVFAFVTLWMGGLAAIIVRTSWRKGWSLPPAWRWPLVCVALSIALSWPGVAFRELDFTLANAWNTRLPVAGVKISGIAAVGLIASTAAMHLIGLLWFDWLWDRFPKDTAAFLRVAMAPLAAGILIACGVGVYQGTVDVSFLSGHRWPSIHRATGTLMDANIFGMLSALWAPAFLVLAVRSGNRAWAVLGAVAILLSGAGVWLSGSRTAAMAGVLGAIVAVASLRGHVAGRTSRSVAVWCGAAALVLVVLAATVPTKTVTALERGRNLVPAFSAASVRWTLNRLWTRDGYGSAAVAMIRQSPYLGVGVGSYVTLVHDFALEGGLNIPPDNAQNWLRHQLAELGLWGSLGWILWVGVFGIALWPRPGQKTGPAVALRGPLIGFGLASLVGMPGQEPAIVFTFWLFVFWYAVDAGVQPGSAGLTSRVGWIAAFALAASYGVLQARPSDLRPPVRAARFGFVYTYGFYFDSPANVWSAKHGVTVQPALDNWMRLTVWAAHPDANEKPVDVDVWVGHEHVVDRRLPRDIPITRYVRVPGPGKRFVLEAKVDRTFQPSDYGASSDQRDLGVAIKWEFVPRGSK